MTWKLYQDLAGATFSPDFGDGGAANSFEGNYTDNSLLYFAQYAASSAGSPLFDNACTGTNLTATQPAGAAPASVWKNWALSQFTQFKADVQSGKLPQVSYLVAPAGYTEHSAYPNNYGAWYIAQVLDILTSNPEVFAKTVFIINYDEADGSFDHVVPPSPPTTPSLPASPNTGGSTVDYHNEIVTTSTPNGPIGLGSRVPCIVISPWSRGGYVNSQVFDHTSVIQFIEKRFGVHERNLSPWRRAVCGDLTSVFNFKNPNFDFDHDEKAKLPSTDGYLPPIGKLSGAVNPPSVNLTASNVIVGVPKQEKDVRPARALPYELDAYVSVDVANNAVVLTFLNTGKAAVVFHVRSGNAADQVRMYTVESGKTLSGSWTVSGTYDLKVYGPNGFARFFKGAVAGVALQVRAHHEGGESEIRLSLRNAGSHHASVTRIRRLYRRFDHAPAGGQLRPGGRRVFAGPLRRLVRPGGDGRGRRRVLLPSGGTRRDRTRQRLRSCDGRPGDVEGLTPTNYRAALRGGRCAAPFCWRPSTGDRQMKRAQRSRAAPSWLTKGLSGGRPNRSGRSSRRRPCRRRG